LNNSSTGDAVKYAAFTVRLPLVEEPASTALVNAATDADYPSTVHE